MAIEQGYVYGMLNLAVLYAEKKMHFSNLVMRVCAGLQHLHTDQLAPKVKRPIPRSNRESSTSVLPIGSALRRVPARVRHRRIPRAIH